MPRHYLASLALFAAALCLAGGPLPVPATQPISPGRVVAIGDVHGAADQLLEILQAAGLTDAAGNWTGGTATLVQTGDYLDRGGQARRVLDLLMALDGAARRAGGRAEILLGNHEVMNLLHDFSDVSAEAFDTFADGGSEDRRRRTYDDVVSAAKRAGVASQRVPSRDAWMAAHPRGYVEYAEAMGPDGLYGRWLRTRKAAVQIGRTVFMHAGIAPQTPLGVDDVNRDVTRAIRNWDAAVSSLRRARLIATGSTLRETVDAAAAEIGRISTAIAAGQSLDARVTREYVDQLNAVVTVGRGPLLAAAGPMWFRGLSQTPTDETTAEVEALLARLGAARMVVGHTPQLPGRIVPRFANRVFPIDTGMLNSFFKGGRPSALEIAGDRVSAIYVGERQVLADK